MSPANSRRRRVRGSLGPLLAVALSIALLLSPDTFRQRTARWLELSVFAPFRWAVGWGPGSLASQREAARLSELLTERRLEADRIREIATENERLRELLEFRRRAPLELVPGSVVGRDRGRLGDLLRVSVRRDLRGRIEKGVPVLVPEGVLGRVAGAGPEGWIRVESLSSRQSAVSVIDQRTREEGILRWAPEREGRLVVGPVAVQSDWQAGDRVVTSGLGTIFPRGLLVGWVDGVEREEVGPLKRVYVRPAAEPGRVEEVFFLVASAEETSETGSRGAEGAGDSTRFREPEARWADSAGVALFPVPPAPEAEVDTVPAAAANPAAGGDGPAGAAGRTGSTGETRGEGRGGR